MKTEKVETDVLILGGGIAGLTAAIHAAELGAKVVVADKCNTLHSGSGRAGNDDMAAYIPEIHGTLDQYIENYGKGQAGATSRTTPRAVAVTHYTRALEVAQLWDAWGIPMKYKGRWECCGHRFPGLPGPHIKYAGAKQKQVLTEQSLKRGAEIINRVMGLDLLGDAKGVTGAVGVDTRQDRIVEFAAKAVILATGGIGPRMYLGATPALMGNDTSPFTLTGDGRAAAYRLGAELYQMETGGLPTLPQLKNYLRAGKGSWVGVFRYPDGRPVGPYVTKPDHRFGDIISEVGSGELFDPATGKGPIWMDCRGITDDDLEYMEWFLFNEGNKGDLDHMREEGIDFRKHQILFWPTPTRSRGKIWQNEKAETSIKGLYCAGDESHGGIGGAAVFGWVSGEEATKYAKKAKLPSPDKERDKAKIAHWKSSIEAIQTRQYGPNWEDANVALQHTMNDFAGLTRTEPILETGLAHVRRLRKKVDTIMRAVNRWELTRCLETINLYDLAELVILAALERKESRVGTQKRLDYEYTNPLLGGKVLVVKKVADKPVLEWREIQQTIK